MLEIQEYNTQEAEKDEYWQALLNEISTKTDFADFYKQFSTPQELLNHLFSINLMSSTPAEKYLSAILLNYQQLRLSDAIQFHNLEDDQNRIVKLMKFAKATVGTQLAKIQEETKQPSPIKEGDGEIAIKMMRTINEQLLKLE